MSETTAFVTFCLAFVGGLAVGLLIGKHLPGSDSIKTSKPDMTYSSDIARVMKEVRPPKYLRKEDVNV